MIQTSNAYTMAYVIEGNELMQCGDHLMVEASTLGLRPGTFPLAIASFKHGIVFKRGHINLVRTPREGDTLVSVDYESDTLKLVVLND